MSNTNLCSACSAPIPADAPHGLCPACLIKGSLKSAAQASSIADTHSMQPDSTSQRPPGSRPDPLSIEELAPFFPQLEILELLGRGGMGMVYKARQKHLERFVALKILPTDLFITPAFTERFIREARALAKLSHPNIVAVYDFGKAQPAGSDPLSPTAPALYYLLMEFVDGANLRKFIKSLAPAQALAIVPQICDALQFAHDEGIIHRDIKPENILLDKKGRVKIADFGLAKILQSARGPADYTLTHPDRIMGTLHYMAPEQLERPTEVDHRADIYSLGVVLYELLTGQLPLGRFPLPSEKAQVDARLDDVVLKTLEHEPEKRYQHASEVKTSVESVRDTPAPPATAAPALPAPPAPRASVSGEKVDTLVKVEQPQRLSRNAIIGAICGVVALFTAVVSGVAYSNIQRQYYFDSHAGLYHEGPDWAIALWCAGLAVAGIGAVVMPLLGAIAVAQIRRAPEKLYGLRLALFDALLVPLALFDTLAFGLLFAAFAFHEREGHAKAASETTERSVVGGPFLGFLVLVPVLLADVGAYWWLWKKLRIQKPQAQGTADIPRFPLALKVLAAMSVVVLAAMIAFYFAGISAFSGVLIVGAALGLTFSVANHSHNEAQIRRARELGLWPALGEIPTMDHVKRLAQAGEIILAIRLYRHMHPTSLAEARAIVENIKTSAPATAASPSATPATQPLTTAPPHIPSSAPPDVVGSMQTAAIPMVPTKREPKRFYVFAFALYCVCWVLPLLLWNWGWVGFVLSVVVFATIPWLQARYLQKFRPEIVAARAREPRWMKALWPSKINLSFTLAFFLLLLALALHEDSTPNPDFANIFQGSNQTLSETSQDFLKRFQANDAKRLSADVRDLSLREAMGSWPDGLTVSGGNTEGPPMAALFRPIHSSLSQEIGIATKIMLYPSAIPPEFRQVAFYSLFLPLGLWLFMAGFADMLSSKGYKFSGLAWKPAFLLAGLLIASYFIVSSACAIIFDTVRDNRQKQGQFATFQATFPIESNSAQAAENLFPTLDRWALDNGYEIAAFTDGKLNDSHRLPEVPTNVAYRAAVLWKPGLFDRLGMDWEGIYNKAPEILVQAANTDNYSEIDLTTSYFGSGNYASSVESNRINKDLHDTLAKMAATSQPAATGTAASAKAPPLPTTQQATVLPPSDANLSKLLGFWRTENIVPAPGREPATQELWFAPDGNARVGTTVRTKGHYRLDGDKIVFTDSDGKFVATQPFHFDGDQLVLTPTSSDPGMQGGLPMTLYRLIPGKTGDIVGTWRALSNYNGPPRLGNGAITLVFDKETFNSGDLDFDVPELAMKYSIQGNHLYYRIADGPVLTANVSFVSDIGLSLDKFTANGGKFTYYQRDKLGIGDPAATRPDPGTTPTTQPATKPATAPASQK